MSDEALRTNAIEWYSAGILKVGFSSRERLVRAWRPGDGLNCSAAGYQKKHPCPPPVAVVKDALVASHLNGHQPVVTRVVYIRHLAAAFGAGAAPQQEQATEKSALEALAQRHWDEYQAILADQRAQLLRSQLSMLPDELRDQVMTAMESDDPEGGAS